MGGGQCGPLIPRLCRGASASPRQLHVKSVSQIGDIRNDSTLLLQQGNLRSLRGRLSKSSAKKSIVMPKNL